MTSTHILTAMLLALAPAAASAQGPRPDGRPVTFEVDTPFVHDPVMAYADGTYYLFSTGRGIAQATSRDMRRWTVTREGVLAPDAIPAWTHDSVPGFRDHIWAPDIIRYRGRWYMTYSCSTFGRNTSAIGLLSTASLASPQWRDEGCVVASREKRDDWNAIDPNIVVGDDGQPWLFYGSFWDGIQMVRLDTTLHVAQGCSPVTIARRYAQHASDMPDNPTSRFAGRNAIEAPFVMRHGDYYYLFVSWDYCCQGSRSTYRVAVGRASKPDGPYLDRDGRDMAQGGGTLFVEGDKNEYDAMGHCAAYSFEGRDVFICHGYSVSHDGQSMLVRRDIAWTDDGWPVLR